MSNTAEQVAAYRGHDCQPVADRAEFTELIAEMVSDQAPRVFAIVVEYGDRVEAQVAAWGLALDESAYMITTDGKNQFHLTEPENAVKYVRGRSGTVAHLVWATPRSCAPQKSSG
jgi:hypothetical protein